MMRCRLVEVKCPGDGHDGPQMWRLLHGCVFVPPDFVRYKAASQSVREIFQRHTDAIVAR
jgi:nucleotidyltransferase/DNA polymerase involved in DNA repair